MLNSEYYGVKSGSMLNLVVILVIAIGVIALGIFFLPQLVESYFSYDLSSVAVSPPLSLPKSGNEIVLSKNLNNFQLPQGVSFNMTESAFGRANPFAPL
jgi:hypothetical protein